MNGPSVPWEVMAPHESQAQRNHSQSLQRLAERGGLGTGEAWCIVNDIECPTDKATWADYDAKWKAFAERINLHYDELEKLRRENAEMRAELETVRTAGKVGHPPENPWDSEVARGNAVREAPVSHIYGNQPSQV